MLIIKKYQDQLVTLLICLFFILVLHFKASYTAIPLLLSIIGIAMLIPDIRKKEWKIRVQEKHIIISVLFYFAIALIALLTNGDRLRELDLPSKALLLLPLLFLWTKVKIHTQWIIYAIILGSLLAGAFSAYRFYILDWHFTTLFPQHMSIQAGGISMSLALFCFACSFYLYKHNKKFSLLALSAGLSALIASIAIQARGAWIAFPFGILIIVVLSRQLFSKKLLLIFTVLTVSISFLAGDTIKNRWSLAINEIKQYQAGENRNSNVGSRLDMWKSSLIAIQERPFLGRSEKEIAEMRQLHLKEGKIGEAAAGFTNPHNQYFNDADSRGVLGLFSLFSIFLVPLWIFIKNLKISTSDSLAHLFGVLGITHICSVMTYCLTQSFLSHNSGFMFYFFITFLFYGLQKSALPKNT